MLACTKSVSIKWGNSNFARTVWRFCKNVFIFKEFATDDSNASFELWLCRVVLVVFPITNADMVMFTWRDATRCVKRQYKS